MTITMKLNSRKFSLQFTCSLYLIALAVSFIEASAYYQHNGQYNPEEQDGIPVFSARSVAKLEDDWNGNMLESMKPRVAMAQRRQADNDLDDGLEEEDEDEYKSGSSPHESIESPSYGESQRFAKDGDDIENFFDTHLGPPKDGADSAGDESSEQPTIVRQEMVPAVDPDDDYEAAASGPLATIFQSLLSHSQDGHKNTKRPFLQISTSTDSDADSDSATGKTVEKGKEESGLKTSQSAQSFVEASSPITLSIRPTSPDPQSVSPGQEPMVHESTSGFFDSHGPAASLNLGAGMREIYIGRRPTVMSYLQQQQQQRQPLQHLSGGYTTSGSANIWRGPNGQPVVYEQEQASDYSRYPVAASYAYQQQPGASEPATDGGQGHDDDEQTVTYGLSFGGAGGAAETDESPSSAHEQEAVDSAGNSAESPVQQPQAQSYQTVPYQTPYTTSSTRALNNYYNNYYNGPQQQQLQSAQGFVRAYPVQMHRRPMMKLPQKRGQSGDLQRQRLMPKHYARGHQGATRYHRDPSESSNIMAAVQNGGAQYDPASYGAIMMLHRGLGDQHTTAVPDLGHSQERQRLLASLDREIKASPHYRTNQVSLTDASARMNSYLNNPNSFGLRQSVSFQDLKKNYLGDDLDTYNSYHSETDPYKTQTTTSHMVNNPLAFLAQTQQPATTQQNGLGDNEAGTSSYVSNQTPESNLALQNVSQNGAMQQGTYKQYAGGNLLTGPLSKNYDNPNQIGNQGDLLRNDADKNSAVGNAEETIRNQGHSRVRRDDSDEREIDNDQDDDGVWVDDDEDDDNRQQSSDVNETSQYPGEEEEEDNQQDDATNNVLTPQQINPPGVIGGPHGYELSPNDLMIYHG